MEVLSPEDAPGLAKAHAACFDRPWSVETFARLASLGTGLVAGVRGEADITAFVAFMLAGESADLVTLGVVPPARGRGLGHLLLQESLPLLAHQGVEKVILEVCETNQAARALYAANGFKPQGVRKAYYRLASGGPKDALVLARKP